MKEVLRLVDAKQQGPRSANLRNYNLEVFAGEIVVICGLAGSGMKGLLNLMDGSSGLSGGGIYINEEPAPLRRDEGKLWKQIYVCGDIRNQFENLTVAENLDLLSQTYSPLQRYSRKRVVERARRYLLAENVEIDPEAKLSTLSYSQRICLNLLQAKMAHASLVVLDSTKHIVVAEGNGTVRRMIRRMSCEGMAFLMLSYREDVYYSFATRIQKISYGTDIMERRSFRERSGRTQKQKAEQRRMPNIHGIRDEWINYADVTEYLTVLRQKNQEYWARELDFSIPEKQMCCDGSTVLVPRDSAWQLLENLSVSDNLILPIPNRVGRGLAAYIPERVAENAVEEFYRVTGIDPMKKQIRALSMAERKILSLYRWEQARPKVMVLQNPHFGLDRMESRQLDEYLLHLAGRGSRICILSSSLENLKKLCAQITIAEFGEHAQLLEKGLN